jgi:hypothetical protein
MGGQQQAQPPTPQDSAQAQAMAQAAGTKFNIATSPVQAYAEALNQIQFNPIFQRVQSAANANSALANAQANQETMAQTNPYGFGGQQAFGKYEGSRLANIMGGQIYPGLTPTNTSGAFKYPTQSQLPDLREIQAQAATLGSAIPTLQFQGAQNLNPMLNYGV